MDRMPALPGALIAIATVSGLVACGSSGVRPAGQATHPAPPRPAATTVTPRPPPRSFMSQRYGFRVTLNEGWSEHDALVDWNGKRLQGLRSRAFANFTDAAAGRTLAAGAAHVAKATRLAEWRAAMIRAAPAVCSDASSVKDTTLDGEPAVVWTATCSDGYDVNKLATLHGTRGYIVLLASPSRTDGAQAQRIFESIRRSFRFTRS